MIGAPVGGQGSSSQSGVPGSIPGALRRVREGVVRMVGRIGRALGRVLGRVVRRAPGALAAGSDPVRFSEHGIGCICSGPAWVWLDGEGVGDPVPDPFSAAVVGDPGDVLPLDEGRALVAEGVESGSIPSPGEDPSGFIGAGISWVASLVAVRGLPESERGSAALGIVYRLACAAFAALFAVQGIRADGPGAVALGIVAAAWAALGVLGPVGRRDPVPVLATWDRWDVTVALSSLAGPRRLEVFAPAGTSEADVRAAVDRWGEADPGEADVDPLAVSILHVGRPGVAGFVVLAGGDLPRPVPGRGSSSQSGASPDLVVAARAVVDAWEDGDLAGAVRDLAAALDGDPGPSDGLLGDVLADVADAADAVEAASAVLTASGGSSGWFGWLADARGALSRASERLSSALGDREGSDR